MSTTPQSQVSELPLTGGLAQILVQCGLLRTVGSVETERVPASAPTGEPYDNAFEITKRARTMLLWGGASSASLGAAGTAASAVAGSAGSTGSVPDGVTIALAAATTVILVTWWLTRAWLTSTDLTTRARLASAAMQARADAFAALLAASGANATPPPPQPSPPQSRRDPASLSDLTLSELLMEKGTMVETTTGISGHVTSLRWDASTGLHIEVENGNGRDFTVDEVRSAHHA